MSEENAFKINDKYSSADFINDVKECLTGDHENSKPFPHFLLEDFLEDETVVKSLAEELDALGFRLNSNDLYDVWQTPDLGCVAEDDYSNLSRFRLFFQDVVRKWLQDVTGVVLNAKISMNGSKYDRTNTLLPHDDRLESRAFAFVFYLSDNWKEEFGGCLKLYDSDKKKNRPTKVAKFLLPKRNSLMLFCVQQNSWHSVDEVIEDRSRISINGWFHADNAPMALPPSPEVLTELVEPCSKQLDEINEWVNPEYVEVETVSKINKLFAKNSELSLANFLQAEKYEILLSELQDSELFNAKGPLERRNVFCLNESKCNNHHMLARFLNFMRSDAMLCLLTKLTSIELCNEVEAETNEFTAKKAKYEEGNDTVYEFKANSEIRLDLSVIRMGHRCYTMVDDQLALDTKRNGYSFELHFFLGEELDKWSDSFGGYMSYFGVNETDEILRIAPLPNTLAIVLREPDVLKFTKYINCNAGDSRYFLISCSVYGIREELLDGSSDSENDEEVEDEDEE